MLSRRSVIITSAAYVSSEIAAEIGHLPPALLPLHSRRLFEHQIALFPRADYDVTLTLPEGFQLERVDADRLRELGVAAVWVPTGLSLAESLLYVMTTTGRFSGSVRVLHGDTLMRSLAVERDDMFVAGRTTSYYPWAEYQTDEAGVATFKEGLWRPKDSLVVAGYFAFSDAAALIRALATARGNFVRALNLYSAVHGLRPDVTDDWYDFGHLQTYFASRARYPTARSFNQLRASAHVMTKRSSDAGKLTGEADWFTRLPGPLKRFTPQLLSAGPDDDGGYHYGLELLRLMPLNDLFVFGQLPQLVWSSIFDACDDWLSECRTFSAPAGQYARARELYLPKTLRRLDELARMAGTPSSPASAGHGGLELPAEFSVDSDLWLGDRKLPGLRRIAELAASAIPAIDDRDLCVIHGDFCFSNIFYDHRTAAVKVIDPRGDADLYGDPRYEIAKLHHSAIGLYDFLLAGRYWLETPDPRHFAIAFPLEQPHRDVQGLFSERTFGRTTPGADPAILAASVLLFLAMLPLHAESPVRQRAFIANALRLFVALDQVAR